jgi:hypothetical protein
VAARKKFGVLVWPGMSARSLNYSRTILSWMKEWGFECGFVTVEADAAGGHASPAIPADIRDSASKLSVVSPKLNAIVVADGDLSAPHAIPLKEYLASGGWMIIPSPEDGKPSEEVEALLQLRPSRSATLMAPESPYSDPLGAEEVRLLVSHPIAPGLEIGQWQEWTGPSAKVLYARRDEALPLFCFRRPELPAVRLIPLGDGGVVHWNFSIRPGPLIEEMELKAFLGQTLTWLWGRASWAKPVEKEGTVLGIVRKKDGTAIPAAKVTAKVFSESGEAAQTLEATSSEEGKFSLPLYADGIYWVKAEAEGYYQADMYLLARPKEAEGEQIEVIMEPEGAIFGHAYYGPGEDHPAVGISVTLAPNCRISSAWEKETVTDGNARFSFDHLPAAQTFYLIAKAEGWLGIQEAPVPLDGGHLEVDVHLGTSVAFVGTTVNAATGELLPGVEVLARPGTREGSRFLFADALTQRTSSDEQGEFALALPPGYWTFLGQADGFCAVRESGVLLSEAEVVRPREIVVKLCPYASLYGTVFQSSGESAPGAKVTVDPGLAYWADEKGMYRTDPVAPSFFNRNPTFWVKVEWKEESASGPYSFELPKEGDSESAPRIFGSYAEMLRGTSPLDLHLEAPEPEVAGVTISGSVLGEGGEPIPFARVELREPSSYQSSFLSLQRNKVCSDRGGEFTVSHVPEGLWLIRARKKIVREDGEMSLLWGEAWREVIENVPVPPLEIRLAKAHVRGRISEADGSPVRDRPTTFFIDLHTGGGSGVHPFLTEKGEFTILPFDQGVLTRPPVATYRRVKEKVLEKWMKDQREKASPQLLEHRGHEDTLLRLGRLIHGLDLPWEKRDYPAEGFVRLSVVANWAGDESNQVFEGDVRLGEESLIISLPPYGSIRGRVIDADSRRPVANTHVGLSQEGHFLTSCRTDDESFFVFPRVPAGPCVLHAQKEEDGYWIRWKELEVVKGQDNYVEIDIWKHFLIRGRLLLRDSGQPLVAEVRTDHGAYTTDHRGRFLIPAPATKGVIARLYWFSVPLPGAGLKPAEKPVEYSPWERQIDVGDIYVEREEEGLERSPEE